MPVDTPLTLLPLDWPPGSAAIPVLLLHGIYGAGRLFEPLARDVGPAFGLLTPDMVAHAGNRHVEGPLDAESAAAALVPLIDAAGIDRFHLVGHSHGGAAAQALARLLPGRVATLVLVATYAFQPLTPRERLGGILAPRIVPLLGSHAIASMIRLTRSAGGGRRLERAVAGRLADVIGANDRHLMAESLRRARRFDSRPWLRELRMPTLVVVGRRDHMVSPRQSAILATGVGDGRLRRIDDAGHMLPLSHPDAFARLVRDWLREHEARPAAEPSVQSTGSRVGRAVVPAVV